MCCLTYTGKNETFTTVEIGTKCGKVKNKIQNHCLLWKALSIYHILWLFHSTELFIVLQAHFSNKFSNYLSRSTINNSVECKAINVVNSPGV